MINKMQKIFFALRYKIAYRCIGIIRRYWYTIQGMQLGIRTLLPKIFVTWPHQVKIGDFCVIEHHIYFKFDGIWKPGPAIIIGNNVFIGCDCEFNIRQFVKIGDDSLIASGCKFIDHDHGFNRTDIIIKKQKSSSGGIEISNNVWLGCNVVVLKGVSIGEGAIVAAGAVVTKSILPNEIWGGVPARKIGQR